MSNPEFGFQCIKVVALAATDGERVHRFYGETLGLEPEKKADGSVGYVLGPTVLMPKLDWYGSPTDEPNYRITIQVDDARQTEAALLERGVRISDPVEDMGGFHLGSFLDSEGNKLWICSEDAQPDGGVRDGLTSGGLVSADAELRKDRP